MSVDIWNTKKVKLNFDTSGIATASGYVFTGIEVEPQVIRVAGTSEQLGAITELDIKADELKKNKLDSNEEVIVDITKYLPDGIILADSAGNNVVVRIIVEKAGTKSILLPVGAIQIESVSEKFVLEKGPEQEVELQFSGSKEALEKLTSDNIIATINLKKITEAGTYDIPVEVTELPEECSYIGSASIQITLKKK